MNADTPRGRVPPTAALPPRGREYAIYGLGETVDSDHTMNATAERRGVGTSSTRRCSLLPDCGRAAIPPGVPDWRVRRRELNSRVVNHVTFASS